jgi:hypothetical protein
LIRRQIFSFSLPLTPPPRPLLSRYYEYFIDTAEPLIAITVASDSFMMLASQPHYADDSISFADSRWPAFAAH